MVDSTMVTGTISPKAGVPSPPAFFMLQYVTKPHSYNQHIPRQ